MEPSSSKNASDGHRSSSGTTATSRHKSRPRSLYHDFAPPSSLEMPKGSPPSDTGFSHDTHTTAGSSTTLNLETSDFIPATRISAKRRASDSAAPVGSTEASRSQAAVKALNLSDQPIISCMDLFGMNERKFYRRTVIVIRNEPGESPSDLSDASEESDETPAMEVSQIGRQLRASELDEWLRVSGASVTRNDTATRKCSAILVYPEMTFRGAAGQATGHVRYLPLRLHKIEKKSCFAILPDHRHRIDNANDQQPMNQITWPLSRLPVELFDYITEYLARDDVKSMRLVNKEFESKVSHLFFDTCVVPFNTELYDMIDEESRTKKRALTMKRASKGKAKVGASDPMLDLELSGLQWQNAKDDRDGKVYRGHGLRVFQGFGPHIKRFGMSFEVSEKQLTQLRAKRELHDVAAYHGTYSWPPLEYARFANLEGLERTADETSRMKAAFAHLKVVQELGLSIDSGLGWLNGPDKSLHASLFECSSPVFGTKRSIPDHAVQKAREFWAALQSSSYSFDTYPNFKETSLVFRPLSHSPSNLLGLREKRYTDTRLWSSIEAKRLEFDGTALDISGFGVLHTSHDYVTSLDAWGRVEKEGPQSVLFRPAALKREQCEWLLETEWAQRAFLESYMLAIIDNPSTFENVTTLNIAKLSSGFLTLLAREVFWDALPALVDVTLRVSPDWRTVEKDSTGHAVTKDQNPSDLVDVFYHNIVHQRISTRESITKLNIGYVGGGEHAQGIFARNAHILPAPISRLEYSLLDSCSLCLVFPYVEHLTLSNCWITPQMLEGLVTSHASMPLKCLTLDSVSLTARARWQKLPPLRNNEQVNASSDYYSTQNHPVARNVLLNIHEQESEIGLANLQIHNRVRGVLSNLVGLHSAAHQPNPGPSYTATASLINRFANFRRGSWPEVINLISPGPLYGEYFPTPPHWVAPHPPRRETNLQTLEFRSCGYVRLLNMSRALSETPFDDFQLDFSVEQQRSPWFLARFKGLKHYMMAAGDPFLATIAQRIPPREIETLVVAWGMTFGWQDREAAEEVKFDGLRAGGTGRFSGVVHRDMCLFGGLPADFAHDQVPASTDSASASASAAASPSTSTTSTTP